MQAEGLRPLWDRVTRIRDPWYLHREVGLRAWNRWIAPDPDQQPKVYRDLIDPGDPLASAPELASCAIEVLDELRWNLQDQNGNPEFVDASLDYIREVLDALRERAQ